MALREREKGKFKGKGKGGYGRPSGLEGYVQHQAQQTPTHTLKRSSKSKCLKDIDKPKIEGVAGFGRTSLSRVEGVRQGHQILGLNECKMAGVCPSKIHCLHGRYFGNSGNSCEATWQSNHISQTKQEALPCPL